MTEQTKAEAGAKLAGKPIEEQIELAVANGYRQADVALLYARAIRELPMSREVWVRINSAITARWPKGLDRVKKLAWEAAESHARALIGASEVQS